MDNFKLLVIARFHSQPSAALASGILSDAGIPCTLQDEVMSQLYVPMLVGGIKLCVPDDFKQQALDILNELDISSMTLIP